MDDFKHGDENIPKNRKVDETTKKTNQEGGFKPLNTKDKMPPSLSDVTEVDVTCSLNQFAAFFEASESVQNGIVKGQKFPPKKKFFYYQTSNASISKSILLNDTKPLYDGIKKLKNTSPIGKQKLSNKVSSIEAIESFLKMKLPGSFIMLEKEKLKYKNQLLNVFGVWVKISPNVVFITEIKGESVIGAVKLHSAKSSPFNKMRMKVVSFLLKKFLDRIVKEKGDLTVLPNLCICIDVFDKTYVTAPVGTDEPSLKLKRSSLDYISKWNRI